MYASFEFYTVEYYGSSISEADFPRLSSRASDFIDYYTQGKAEYARDAKTITAVKKACCAVAEEMQIDENARAIAAKAQAAAIASSTGEVKSESVGSWSVSYATSEDYARKSGAGDRRDAKTRYIVAAREYLEHTGLLYRGGMIVDGVRVKETLVAEPKFTLDDDGNLYVEY